jgi:hypothetical protein
MNATFQRKVLETFRPFATFFSTTTWKSLKSVFNHGVYWKLTEEDHNALRRRLASGYYLILVGGHPSLSIFLIKCITFIKTREWPTYTHVLMNVDNIDDPLASDKFRLVEAIGTKGVTFSSFMQVFDCDQVTLLQPRGFTPEEWEAALNEAKKNVGKGYDSLFDLLDDSEMSCVELVRDALIKADPDYYSHFSEFEEQIKNVGDLTPQMFLDAVEFDIVHQVER